MLCSSLDPLLTVSEETSSSESKNKFISEKNLNGQIFSFVFQVIQFRPIVQCFSVCKKTI